MIRASASDRAISRSRLVVFGIVFCASLVPFRGLSQAPTEDEIGTAVAPTEEEATPRRRGTRERGGGSTATTSTGRRGGARDEVGTDTRRGGTRDEVTEAPTQPTANENLRNLPTGESPTSVSPQSIRLPSGEGTIEGMGESFSPVLSAGTATYTVPLSVPAGRNGVEPSFDLSYASSNGNGVVGIGWSMDVPFIARQTDRGTPRYQDGASYRLGEDRFIYNGGQELVPVDSTAMSRVDAGGYYDLSAVSVMPAEVAAGHWQQYRAKVEGAFLRFFRSPDGKRWLVQSLDGTLFEFGLLSAGSDRAAGFDDRAALQSEGSAGTGRIFAWFLTRMSDSHGSTIYYQYREVGTARYLSDVYYVSPAQCAEGTGAIAVSAIRGCQQSLENYGAHVRFEYESRPDVLTSYVSGWAVPQSLRLARVSTFAANLVAGTRYLVRRYHLAYVASSFHSMLATVTVEGRQQTIDTYGVAHFVRTEEGAVGAGFAGERLPPVRFGYSSMPSGGAVAPGFGGLDSTVRTITNSPPVSLDAPLVDLFDVNGDGLDDVMVTDSARYRTQDGAAGVGVYWNGFTGNDATPAGRAGVFSNATVIPLQNGAESVLRLSNPNLLGMDVDGDGRGDFMHLPPTLGHGWITPARLVSSPAASPMQQGWAFVHTPRPVDVANDPQIKLAQDGTFYRVLDVNNDHLIDIVRTTGTSLQTWMNLGWIPGGEGRFGQASIQNGAWVMSPNPVTSCLPHDGLPLDFGNAEVRLGDMNGDGLTDIIRMRQGRVTYWPGRGGAVFGDGDASCATGFGVGRHVEMATPPTEVNAELAGVFLQDIDGDGADDIAQVRYHQVDVWFNRAGQAFTPRITIDSPFAPDYAPNLRFVDIDGTGTPDLLYGRATQWQYLDLLGGQRPRLLTSVANGLGATTSLEYGSSAEDYTRDLAAASGCTRDTCERFTWDAVRGANECDSVIGSYAGRCVYRSGGSPVISSVLRRAVTSDNFRTISGSSQAATQEFQYHDGYFEGIEQEFRGFGAADVHVLGDATVPGEWTRSYFEQGRRPNAIATSRLADNPEEAIKGSAFLTETFDEGGRFVSTTHSSMTVRRLATGLDGRPIAFAFGTQSDHFLYDTTTYQSQSSVVSLPSNKWEEVGATGSSVTPTRAESRNVRVRATRYVWTRSTTEETDNLGVAHSSIESGRLHDEDDGAGVTLVEYHEAIGSRSTSTFTQNAEGGWLLCSTGGYTYDFDLPGVHLGETHSECSATGDVPHAYQDVPDALTLDFAPSYSYGGATQRIETSTTFDAFGGALETCEGANLAATSAASCFRYSSVTLEPVYRSMPITESIVASREPGSTVTLTTSATWDRDAGHLSEATDWNGAISRYSYDAFGRLTSSNLPDGYRCNAQGSPEIRIRYVLADDIGANVSYVETTTDTRTVPTGSETACSGERTSVSREYFDGLGRGRGEVGFAATERPNEVLVSSLVEFDSRGNVRKAFDPSYVTASTDPAPGLVLRPQANLSFTLAEYDTFGRMRAATAQDGSVARTEFHASSALGFEANDDPQQNLDSPQDYGTPTIVRTDGHGRTIETIEILRQPGELAISARYIHVVTRYRADGVVLEASRAETSSAARLTPESVATVPTGRWTRRTFTYDLAGRRLTSSDPNADSRVGDASGGKRQWRYLFNRVGDLVATRDPRGCGQDFFYDRAGRLVGEDYIGCAEAQSTGGYVATLAHAVGMSADEPSRDVEVRNYFDAYPDWSPAPPAGVATDLVPKIRGRLAGSIDRAQRITMGLDARANAIWTARQIAVIENVTAIAGARTGDSPLVDVADSSPGAIVFDPKVHIIESSFDGGGRTYSSTFPTDPDWNVFRAPTDSSTAPTIKGRLTFDEFGRVNTATLVNAGVARPIVASTRFDAFGNPTELRYLSATPGLGITQTFSFDRVHRPLATRVERENPAHIGSAPLSPENPNAIRVPFAETYEWDRASNLRRVTSVAGPDVFPDRYRQTRRTIDHDSLGRVAHVALDYLQDDRTWSPVDAPSDFREERTRANSDGSTHGAADPMRSAPAPMLPPTPSARVVDLTYEYDWLANQTVWDDDAQSFHERSIGSISNGANAAGGLGSDPTLRPTALYIASNIRTNASIPLDPQNGWVDVDYGVSGNVVAVTARAQCTNRGANECVDDPSRDPADRESHLVSDCTCANEQHFEYRWDELNRMVEARRYDRHGSGDWTLHARQRSRFDAEGMRVVKQSIDPLQTNPELKTRTHLYVYPGDFERVGVRTTRTPTSGSYDASTWLGSETQYLVAGATLVHKSAVSHDGTMSRADRLTLGLRDPLGSASAVVDLVSGHLVELSTFTPNGARETHWTTRETSLAPERNAFAGAEEDEEVGLHCMGSRFLISRIGRWASPDPLSIHAGEGGEYGNAYHYVGGNLLQARDPTGLRPSRSGFMSALRGVADAGWNHIRNNIVQPHRMIEGAVRGAVSYVQQTAQTVQRIQRQEGTIAAVSSVLNQRAQVETAARIVTRAVSHRANTIRRAYRTGDHRTLAREVTVAAVEVATIVVPAAAAGRAAMAGGAARGIAAAEAESGLAALGESAEGTLATEASEATGAAARSGPAAAESGGAVAEPPAAAGEVTPPAAETPTPAAECTGNACSGPGSCFVAGTLVATESGFRAIEDIEIGDRVLAGNDECAADHVAPDWVRIHLELPNPLAPQDILEIDILRSESWFEDATFDEVGRAWMELPELEIAGWARINSVTPAPFEERGEGCLVLMTVHHRAAEILSLTLEGLPRPLEVTPPHRMFVEGRGWMRADEIRHGDLIRTDGGAARVLHVGAAPAHREVFNFEVAREHTYRVSELRLWSHNTDCAPNAGAGGGMRAAAAANLRRLGLRGVSLANATYNAGRRALERAGFTLDRITGTGRRTFVNRRTGATVHYDSGRALAPGQRPHWHVRDAAGNSYGRTGRVVGTDEMAGHIPAGK